MAIVDAITGLFRGKKPDAQPTPVISDQQHQEIVSAWNSVDPHPADKVVIQQADERELANKRAQLSQIQQGQTEQPQTTAVPEAKPTLQPVPGVPGITSFEKPMSQPQTEEPKAA